MIAKSPISPFPSCPALEVDHGQFHFLIDSGGSCSGSVISDDEVLLSPICADNGRRVR